MIKLQVHLRIQSLVILQSVGSQESLFVNLLQCNIHCRYTTGSVDARASGAQEYEIERDGLAPARSAA